MPLCVVFTSELFAQIAARYDAGLGDSAQPVAPNQYEFNGQAWTAVLNTNANVTVGSLSPDTTTCVNAWNVSDNSASPGLGVSYSYPLSPAIHASATSNGWELTVVSRMADNFGGSASGFIQFGDTNSHRRFLIYIGYFSPGPMSMQLVGTNGGNFAFAGPTNYHMHKIVYSPITGTANYYVDAQLIRSGWAGDSSPDALEGPAFGANSDSGTGSVNFNLVQFGVEPPGPVATALHCIQLGPYPQRVAFQWNEPANSTGPAIKEYVVYRNGLEIQRLLANTCVDVYLLPCRYDYTVVAVDTNNNSYASSLPFTVTSLQTTPVTGVRNVKVLLMNFPDYPGEPFTANDANDVVFNSASSVRAYFHEVSYGQLTLQGDSAGWFTMPHPASNYCATRINGDLWYNCGSFQLTQDALSVLPPDQTNNLSSYDDFILVFQGLGTAGVSGGLYKIFSATNGFKMDIIAHELGHGLDVRGAASLMHASGWSLCTAYPVGPDFFNPAARCTVDRYGDYFDVMGAGNSFHLSMYHKEMLGFLQPTNIQVADHDGDYTLYAAEIVTNAVQMIKLPLGHEMF